jgi:von Willebrand factor type A domain/Aerotolerance regulator N-terminal
LFLNPLGLLALLGLPAVLGLHLYRRRFRRHPVSAVFLWEAQDHTPLAGRRREPLRTNPSFWFELLAALLLALAIAGLRVFGAGEAQHLVVVLDASASMGAIGGEGSARERALDVVRERIAGLPAGSQVTVVVSGSRPETLIGPAAFRGEALARLDDYLPGQGRHALGPAVGLAQQLAGGGDVLLVTDRYDPEAWPEELGVVAVGVPTDNLAITHASRRRERDDEGEWRARVHLTLTNHGEHEVTTEVVLSAEEHEFARRNVTLAAGARKSVAFSLPADAPVIQARLPGDALTVDDRVWLAPAPARTLALASTLSTGTSRFLGLTRKGEDSNISRWLELIPDAVDVKDPAKAHLVLSEGPVAGDAWVFSLEHPGEERQHLIGPFLTDKRHPLLAGVTLEGLIWTLAPQLDLSAGAPVISAGDRPLLTEGRDGERVLFRANLDPIKSSLHRSPDWPILLANLAELRRRELPGASRSNLRVGETFIYRDREPARYRLSGPEDFDLRAMGTLVVEDVRRPGVYTLERIGEDEQAEVLGQVAFNFVDPAESDLTQLSSGERAGSLSLASVLSGHSWVEGLLLAVVLGLVLADWWILAGARRRFEGS